MKSIDFLLILCYSWNILYFQVYQHLQNRENLVCGVWSVQSMWWWPSYTQRYFILEGFSNRLCYFCMLWNSHWHNTYSENPVENDERDRWLLFKMMLLLMQVCERRKKNHCESKWIVSYARFSIGKGGTTCSSDKIMQDFKTWTLSADILCQEKVTCWMDTCKCQRGE